MGEWHNTEAVSCFCHSHILLLSLICTKAAPICLLLLIACLFWPLTLDELNTSGRNIVRGHLARSFEHDVLQRKAVFLQEDLRILSKVYTKKSVRED